MTFVPRPTSDPMVIVWFSRSRIRLHRYRPMPVDFLSARPVKPV